MDRNPKAPGWLQSLSWRLNPEDAVAVTAAAARLREAAASFRNWEDDTGHGTAQSSKLK